MGQSALAVAQEIARTGPSFVCTETGDPGAAEHRHALVFVVVNVLFGALVARSHRDGVNTDPCQPSQIAERKVRALAVGVEKVRLCKPIRSGDVIGAEMLRLVIHHALSVVFVAGWSGITPQQCRSGH